jgi:hypothetical protein
MPVVGCSDADCVNVLAIEQLSDILVHSDSFAIVVAFLQDGRNVVRVAIAYRGDANAMDLAKVSKIAATFAANLDERAETYYGDSNVVVGAPDTTAPDRQSSAGTDRTFHEMSSGDLVHLPHLINRRSQEQKMIHPPWYQLPLRYASESSSRSMLADGAKLHQFHDLCGVETD